jgi:hypothetical protein
VSVLDRTTLFATFTLQSAALGLYGITAVNGQNDSTTLADCFTIEESNSLGIAGNVFAPEVNRPGQLSIIRVEFTNAGNTDVVNPRLVLRSLAGTKITLDANNLNSGTTEITFDLKEIDGPAGILRPGGGGFFTVYSVTTGNQLFFLDKE